MEETPQVRLVHFYGKSDKPGNISHDLLLLHVTFATPAMTKAWETGENSWNNVFFIEYVVTQLDYALFRCTKKEPKEFETGKTRCH